MGTVNSKLTDIEFGPGHTAHRLITLGSVIMNFNFYIYIMSISHELDLK